MEDVLFQTIEGQSLTIDGKHFVGCLLIDCILEYSGEPVNFERTLMRGCRYVFYGNARSTVQFLQQTGLMPFVSSEWGEFSDQVN